MSLYAKTLIIISSILFMLVALIYFVSQKVLLSSYSQLETEAVQKDIQRTLNAISDESSQLSIQTGDYAHWDDTYAFAQEPDQQYLADNYYVEALQSIGINFVAIVDSQSEVLFARAVDLESGEEVPVNDELKQMLSTPNPLLDLNSDQGGSEGLLLTSNGPMLITSQHILTSQFDGPPAGTLLMGRLLNPAWIEHLSDSLQLPVQLQAVNDPHLTDDLQTAFAAITKEHPIFVQPVSSSQIYGAGVIDDLYGVPAVMLHVDFPRTIYEQGQTSLSFLMAILVVVSLFFTLSMVVLLERLVLSRVRRVSHALSEARATGDLTRRLPTQGNDELARLAGDINDTLQALAGSQVAIQQANEVLEQRVSERTSELSTTNLLLADEVARHKQTQTMLLQARDKAVEALNLKTRLLANMVMILEHHCRSSRLRSEMLQGGLYGPVTEKQIEVLAGILSSASQLMSFITNLLNESQLQARTMTVKLIRLQVRELVDGVETTVSPLVEAKGLGFKTEISPDVPDTVMGDPERLRQILTNLVHNAIKFTTTGSISVQIFCQNQQHWGIRVSDTGIGISLEAQRHIFEPFWQAAGSIPLENGQGIGLGLSIVKELTTLMGGQVSVVSQPGRGSTFTILLPLQKSEEGMADEQAVYTDY